MNDERAPRRFFSEKEISTVLRRATILQEAAQTTDPTGLTFEELQQIAAEAGIDPHYLTAAVTSLDEEDEDERFHWLGAPMVINLERVVEGEVSEEQWERMVEEARNALGLIGASGRVGQSREWTHDSKERQAQVTVTSRGGQTKLRIFARYPQLAASVFAPAIGLGMLPVIGILTSTPVWLGVPLVIATLSAIFFGLRFLFSQLMRRQKRKMRELLHRLEQIASDASKTPPQPLPEQTTSLDASLLGEVVPEEVPAQTASRTKTSS